MSDEPFLSRWARRKRAAVRGVASPPVQREQGGDGATADDARTGGSVPQGSDSAAARGVRDGEQAARVEGPRPLPDALPRPLPRPLSDALPRPLPGPLPDPATLTPESDFTPFLREGVGPLRRNAALRRLFADPHFNTMDGLDVYIDDYSKPDPIPPAMLAALRHARGLLEPSADAAMPDPVGVPRPESGVAAEPASARVEGGESPRAPAATPPGDAIVASRGPAEAAPATPRPAGLGGRGERCDERNDGRDGTSPDSR